MDTPKNMEMLTSLEKTAAGVAPLRENPGQHTTRGDFHRIVVEWNNTQADYPAGVCLLEIIEQQVKRTPDAVAVVFEGVELTYRDLNGRANKLAEALCGFGVGPEMPVAICVERSLEMVVGLLGILKAGAAYMPVDPHYSPGPHRFHARGCKIAGDPNAKPPGCEIARVFRGGHLTA